MAWRQASSLPTRKVWVGALSTLVTGLAISYFERKTGYFLDYDEKMSISVFVGSFTAWLIPPSKRDRIKQGGYEG